MFLKRRVRHKDGKEHVYYSVCESLRVHGGRTIQRQVLHPGELNTTQIETWQHTIAIISEEDGERLQRRLFTDREGTAPPDAEDVIEVRLSTLRARQPRLFGDCRAGCRLWQELGLDAFWREQLSGVRGAEPWEKVLELLAVNRLPDPRSELYYLVGTPKHQLSQFEAQLTEKGWSAAAPGVAVKLCPEDEDIYVLCRSEGRVEKEHAMRRRALRACVRHLVQLRRTVAAGRLKDPDTIQQRLGGLKERHRPVCRYLNKLVHEEGTIVGEWDREKWKASVLRDGAYLLRAHWPGEHDPATLWQTYIQLTEAEAAIRTLKSEIKVRPVWHWTARRVEAHIMVAFLGYAMHVCLKKLAARRAPTRPHWQVLQHLRKIILVDVEFDTRDDRTLTLPRITIPEKEQAALLLQLGWTLPEHPPPRIRTPQWPPTD